MADKTILGQVPGVVKLGLIYLAADGDVASGATMYRPVLCRCPRCGGPVGMKAEVYITARGARVLNHYKMFYKDNISDLYTSQLILKCRHCDFIIFGETYEEVCSEFSRLSNGGHAGFIGYSDDGLTLT